MCDYQQMNFNSFCHREHGRIVKFEQTIDKEKILCENQRTRFPKEKKKKKSKVKG